MPVLLQPVNGDNLFDCIHAMAKPEQWEAYLNFAHKIDESHVASNIVSIAQSAVYPYLVPLALYDGETVIGFAMYEPLCEAFPHMVPEDRENNGYHICRFMIAHQHQGKGLGKAGLLALIEQLKALPDCEIITNSVHLENSIARSLYESVGFVPTGEMDENEIVLAMRVR